VLPRPPEPVDENDPKFARPPQNKKNETVRLQSEITTEIERDAPHIARMVFGDAKDHPDVVGVPNARLDDIYRQAYANNDREFLQAEARRDPLQFEKVTDRLGVVLPEPGPVAPEALHPAMQPGIGMAPQAAPTAPQAMPPTAPAMPVVPQLPPPPSAQPAMPVIYGPNGQPISGGM
jgi:hypothetical protein